MFPKTSFSTQKDILSIIRKLFARFAHLARSEKTFQFDFRMKRQREVSRKLKVHKFMREIWFFSVINYTFLSWVFQFLCTGVMLLGEECRLKMLLRVEDFCNNFVMLREKFSLQLLAFPSSSARGETAKWYDIVGRRLSILTWGTFLKRTENFSRAGMPMLNILKTFFREGWKCFCVSSEIPGI